MVVLTFEFCVQGDVYPVEPYESMSMNQVLDAHWGVLDDEDVSSKINSTAKETSFDLCNSMTHKLYAML